MPESSAHSPRPEIGRRTLLGAAAAATAAPAVLGAAASRAAAS
ncbi:hypothetical protein SZN_32086, partial [Streptomyces zinciresistens K42]